MKNRKTKTLGKGDFQKQESTKTCKGFGVIKSNKAITAFTELCPNQKDITSNT